nr:TraX family protein [Acetivibrio ethanolgignens]
MIAIIAMTLDHIGVFFVVPPVYFLFRVIGRVAFPIICFLIAEGFVRTKSVRKYILRLSVLAVVSEPIVDKCFYGTFFYSQSQSVLILFVIALFALYISKKVDDKYDESNFVRILLRTLIILLTSVIIYVCKTEYGILGFFMIISSYYFRKKLPVLIAALLACNFFFLDPIQAFGGVAVIPIILYKGKQGRKMGLWMYFYYPIHIIALYIVMVSISTMNSSYIISEKQMTDITAESTEKWGGGHSV